jgi:predicted dehydrogenase
MSKTLRWGILGTGGIAKSFAGDLQLTGRTIAAVGSRSKEGATRFAERFGIPPSHAHDSYAALAADPDVDVIYVATPHPMHADNALLSLRGGKHVLIEKPFAINAKEAKAIVDLAASKGLVVLEAMWTRFLPHMIRMREILASGVIGEIRSVTAFHVQDLPDDPMHRLNAVELGGGALLDLGIYPISFTCEVLGEPATVKASARFRETGADSQVGTVFGYASGALSMTLCSSDTGGANPAFILGTKGRIDIDHTWYRPTTFRLYDEKNQVIESFDGSRVPGQGRQFQADELEQLVEAGKTAGDILSPQMILGVMRTMDRVREAIGLRYPNE